MHQSGDTLRITAQLIEADSGYHLWSQRFDRKFEDVFAVQDEIAAAVVAELKVSVLGDLPKVEEIHPDAYSLYLKGRHFFFVVSTEESLRKAVDSLQAALELEPEYAPAWTVLAQVYFTQTQMLYRDREGMELARAAVEKALVIDDELPTAHNTLGWIRMYYDWDRRGANDSIQRALAIDSGNAEVLNGAGALASTLGRLDKSTEFFQRVIELDPLLWYAHLNLGSNLTAAGRTGEAAAAFHHALELNPQAPIAHFLLGVNYLLENQPQRALAEMKREIKPIPRDAGIVLALHALGKTTDADQALAVLIEDHKDLAAYYVAEICAWRGDEDAAFTWLTTAYEQRDAALAGILIDPLLADLNSDPRWPVFLR